MRTPILLASLLSSSLCTAAGIALHAAEMKTETVTFGEQDPSGKPHTCGMSTAIRAVSTSESDLQTTIEAQVLMILTDDAKGIASQFRVRVLRFDLYEGAMRFVGAPAIIEAELSSEDDEFVATLGADRIRTEDGFYAEWVDPDAGSALMHPFTNAGASRRLVFRDSLSTRGAESVSYTMAASSEEMKKYFDCVQALIARWKAEQVEQARLKR